MINIEFGSLMRSSSYEAKEALLFSIGDNGVAVTHHPVRTENSKVTFLAGRAVNLEDVSRLLKTIENAGDNSKEGWIAPNLLFKTAHRIAWVSEARIAPMHFRVNDYKAILTVPWPRLLFVADETGLRIAAIKSASRPMLDDPVFHAPLMNIFADGRVCRPAEDRTDSPASAGIQWCEDVIYKTAFSHVNHGQSMRLPGKKEVTTPLSLRAWKGLAKQKVFPAAMLMPMRGVSVEQFVMGGAR